MKLTSKQLNAIKNCRTADEIVAKARENSFEISHSDAEQFLSSNEITALSDEELSGVAGGIGTTKYKIVGSSDDSSVDSDVTGGGTSTPSEESSGGC